MLNLFMVSISYIFSKQNLEYKFCSCFCWKCKNFANTSYYESYINNKNHETPLKKN